MVVELAQADRTLPITFFEARYKIETDHGLLYGLNFLDSSFFTPTISCSLHSWRARGQSFPIGRRPVGHLRDRRCISTNGADASIRMFCLESRALVLQKTLLLLLGLSQSDELTP